MSSLPSHGTGFAESEAFMDVVASFSNWTGSGVPDFAVAQRRLHDLFNLRELRNLETVARALTLLVDEELALRGSDAGYKHPDDPDN